MTPRPGACSTASPAGDQIPGTQLVAMLESTQTWVPLDELQSECGAEQKVPKLPLQQG
jgi:hypothetical protein